MGLTLKDVLASLGWSLETMARKGIGYGVFATHLLAFRTEELRALEAQAGLQSGSLIRLQQQIALALGSFVEENEAASLKEKA